MESFQKWRSRNKDKKELQHMVDERPWVAMPPHHPKAIIEPNSKIKMYPSPYDLPGRTKMLCAPQGWWAISWSYLDNDEPKKELSIGAVSAVYGKNSGRLYQIYSLEDALECDAIMNEWTATTSSTKAHQERMLFLAQRSVRKLKMQKNSMSVNAAAR